MVSFQQLLAELRQSATSTRDLGDRFERLMKAYLQTDPTYTQQFAEVYLWQEWEGRGNQSDTGIDLVAIGYHGEHCAIQCKFYDPTHSLQKSDIDSFFTASGKAPFTHRLIISTTDKWSKHAEDALNDQSLPVTRLRVQELENSPIDWTAFSITNPEKLHRRAVKELRPHQVDALQAVSEGLGIADRGKLIMACGTGKTFTALRIAEHVAGDKPSTVLFLVPSIALLSQSLREWTAEAKLPLHCFAVCSDTKVGKSADTSDISTHDLSFPATTDAATLAKQMAVYGNKRALTVIFSTYQSIAAVAEAQKAGVPEFDLIICDEAHRTTGVTIAGEDESHFVRVHDQSFIKGGKRLYMTATPRLYSDSARSKAKENDALLCSMDDEALYGKELHRLGFAEAVARGLLSDYKVIVMAVDEKYVSTAFQHQLADSNLEINLDDAVKIVGCWNGLSKRMKADDLSPEERAPMRRAVAFSRSIADSKRITGMFGEIIAEYQSQHPEETDLLMCELDHVDGGMNALMRNNKLDWLKEDVSDQGNICRILSNARCLSEGVDVPSLDAVMFLNPRNSIVDVVQSVGRVMRKAEGKQYGYIILPVGVPADVTPEQALQNNEKYKVVWQVLQALRAHDDRFNATINQLELNKHKPDNLEVIGVGGGEGSGDGGDSESKTMQAKAVQLSLQFPHLEEWRDALYAKIVLKCGDRRYWEDWAKDVAVIAERHITRIKALLEGGNLAHAEAFSRFLGGLHENLNPSITQSDAIEMLAQHLITKPVFDALFEHYDFAKHNPVSQAMQAMLDALEGEALEKETATLDSFYQSVKTRVQGVDNAEGKQRVIKELYDKFFKTAFPRLAERMGIVYTPIEVVDFIIHSANDALKAEFGASLSDAGVHVLDPFTGTGTFITRLLHSGLIQPHDLPHKYAHELHANEIVLLAYYIAAINIEETYHGLVGGEYQPFEGIVLADTFQMLEGKGTLNEKMFPENNKRAAKQKQSDIRVILGNPPYSAGQKSENDGNKNLKYPQLDERIRSTYAELSNAQNKNSLYDSYIRSFRWASDRIKDKGIICYVTNGKFMDGNTADGLRKSLMQEFSSIYCFNLRGSIRGRSGNAAKCEGQNVFDIMTGVAITLLVKNPDRKGDCQLFYHDIGDYLTRKDKLDTIINAKSINGLTWQCLQPNESGDWINQRNAAFESYLPLGDKTGELQETVFEIYSRGIATSRDAWVYSFSKTVLQENMQRMIAFYNEQVEQFKKTHEGKNFKSSDERKQAVEVFVDKNSQAISWSRGLKDDVGKQKQHHFKNELLMKGQYRPFCKQWLYFDKYFNDMQYQLSKIFPEMGMENLAICVSSDLRKEFSVFITNALPDLNVVASGQCFPLYSYEKAKDRDESQGELLAVQESGGYTRKENIPATTLHRFQQHYADSTITREDVFYYVYGILHSPEYKTRFASDLKKMLPRIPFAPEFWGFSASGRELAQWHLNYETIEPYDVQEHSDTLAVDEKAHYRVEKMAFAKAGKVVDKTTIHYNSRIRISGIPLQAYDYIVNGKPAIEWVMERYAVTTDKDSGIRNDPNEWSDNPRYILDLLKRVLRVSMETVRIVEGLPVLEREG